MTEIIYSVGKERGSIFWAVAEHFKELEGKTFHLSEMEAVKIEDLKNLSTTAKILLSAVAGAVIQHLIDEGFKPQVVFTNGSFTVK